MNLPDDACPIAWPGIRAYRSHCANFFGGSGLFEGTEEEDWEELLKAARGNITPGTVRARAFFVVELIYTELLPLQFMSVSLPDVQRELMDLRFPRTPDGMKAVVEAAAKYKRRFAAREAIARIKKDNRDIQLGFGLAKPVEALGKLAQVCEVVGGCLRRDDLKGMTIVGQTLGWFLVNSSQPPLEAETLVRALLSVDASNPIYPWQREQ